MPKLTKKANRNGRTDPNYRKALQESYFIYILEAIRRELLHEPVKPKTRSKNSTSKFYLTKVIFIIFLIN